jgi:hypothetical protein
VDTFVCVLCHQTKRTFSVVKLTPRSRVLLDKLTVTQLGKKFLPFMGLKVSLPRSHELANPSSCVTFRNKPLAQPPSWRITTCRLTTTSYSIYSQLPSTSGCRLLHPPCCGNRDPLDMVHCPGPQNDQQSSLQNVKRQYHHETISLWGSMPTEAPFSVFVSLRYLEFRVSTEAPSGSPEGSEGHDTATNQDPSLAGYSQCVCVCFASLQMFDTESSTHRL